MIFLKYSIGEFSKLTGLGIHTLRYYEQEHLLSPERNAGSRRCYSEQDLAWAEFIKRLTGTKMPIKEIRQYAALRTLGDSTRPERLELLTAHREALCGQIRQLQEHLENLDGKIDFYRREIARAAEKPTDSQPKAQNDRADET